MHSSVPILGAMMKNNKKFEWDDKTPLEINSPLWDSGDPNGQVRLQ
jgi:hypothetical protein